MKSQFQFSVSIGLALALGGTLVWALGASDAIGYPAGSVVSYGSNPVVAIGGTITDVGSSTLFTAPADQSIVITDVALGLSISDSYVCYGRYRVELRTGGGDVLGVYAIGGSEATRHPSESTNISYSSGLPVPPGESLEIQVSEVLRNCSGSASTTTYSLSGYYAQP